MTTRISEASTALAEVSSDTSKKLSASQAKFNFRKAQSISEDMAVVRDAADRRGDSRTADCADNIASKAAAIAAEIATDHGFKM